MPVSEKPLVERIARVLAGAALSSNAEGSDPSAGDKVDLRVARACEPGARGAPHHARAGRGHGGGRRCRSVAQDGRGRDRANTSIEPARRERGEQGRRRPALDPRRVRPRVEPILRRRIGAERCIAGDPRELRRGRAGSAVGGQRLSAAAVGAAAARRSARRPFRAQAAAGDRHHHLRRHVAGLRACAEPSGPARRARCARHRRGAAAAQQPRAAQRRLPGREARARRRHLGGCGSRGGGDRAADRRMAGRHRRAGRRSSTSTCRLRSARSCLRCASSTRAAKLVRGAPIMLERCSRPRASAGSPTR